MAGTYTENDFINTDPGYGNVNLLIDTSPNPDELMGITINVQTKNGLSSAQALQNQTSVSFTYEGSLYEPTIVSVQDKGTYYYFQIDTGSSATALTYTGTDSDDELVNILPVNNPLFDNSDYNPLLSNADSLATKPGLNKYQVDRDTNQKDPDNLDAIISSSAEIAKVQLSNYTSIGNTNSKYKGTKIDNTNPRLQGENPALGLISFKGSVHNRESEPLSLCPVSLPTEEREFRDLVFYNRAISLDQCISYSLDYTAGSGTVNVRYLDCALNDTNIDVTGGNEIGIEGTNILAVKERDASADKTDLVITEVGVASGTEVFVGKDKVEKDFFPVSGSLVFVIEEGELVKVTNKRIWIEELNVIRDTDKNGRIYYNSLYSTEYSGSFTRGFECPVQSYTY